MLDARVAGLLPSPTLTARDEAGARSAAERPIYRLGLGQSPFPVPQSVAGALCEHACEKDYLPVRGLPELRRVHAEYLARRFRIARGADDVLVGPGSKQLMFLLQFCFAGELLIPTPAWVSYAPQARLCGRALRFLPTLARDRYRVDPDALARACLESGPGPRLLILNYPGNPTGCSYDRTDLQALAAVCRRHQLIVLSDEIYAELSFEGGHHSLAEFYPEGTIVSGGLSKWCGAGGWRLGTFSFPAQLRPLADAMAAMATETHSATCAPVQYAAVAAFAMGPELERYLQLSRRILSALSAWSAAQLRGVGLEVPEAAGGFYLFPSFESAREQLAARGIRSDFELGRRLLQDVGVSALAGRHFGLPDDSLQLRVALVDFDGERALAAAAAARDGVDPEFLNAWCKPTLDAIRAIAQWTARA